MDSDRPQYRVLHVTPSFYPAHSYGGPIVALYELCRAQKAAGLQVRVLTSDAALSGYGGRWVHKYGVPTFYGRVALYKDIAPELLCQLPSSVRWADLVHVTGIFSATSLLGMASAVSLGRPCVVSPRGSLLPWALAQNSRQKHLALRLLAPLFSRVSAWHATSEEEAAALRESGAVHPQATIHVIGNGVSPFCESATTAAAGTGSIALGNKSLEQPRIVILGRIHPVKNLELALLALAELRRRAPQATLLLVGKAAAEDGAYLCTLHKQAVRLGLSVAFGPDKDSPSAAAVRFLGTHTGVAKQQILASADVLWLCSHMESFGNVVPEALAAGTPVVAAQTTPWRWLQDAALGRWVSPTAAEFAQATHSLLEALRPPARRAAFIQRCQEALQTHFAWPRIEIAMRALYAAAQTRR